MIHPGTGKKRFLRGVCAVVMLGMLVQMVTACSPGPKATAQAATPLAAPLPSATWTPTATATAMPTLTTTPTLVPTATATLEPTPTPEGFYVDNKKGFGFVIPAHWKKEDKKGTEKGQTFEWTQFSFLNGMIVLHVLSSAQEKERVFDDFLPELFEVKRVTGLGDKKNLTLGNGIQAKSMDVFFDDFTVRVIYTYSGQREYVFLLEGFKGRLDAHKKDVDPLLNSIALFRPRPYGLAYGETLHLLGGDPDPADLDPAVTMTSAANYVGLLFAGLVRLSPELKVEPSLAEKWQISPDGKVYTFTLRPGVKFASGSPITAQDFKDSWERAADPKTKSSTAITYLGDIAGFHEKLSGKAIEVSGVKALDERTLQVTLEKPVAYFLAKLTYPTSFVYRVRQADKPGWTLDADASGPYKIREYHHDEALVFERNPNALPLPAIRYVVYEFYPGGSEIGLFKEGSLDMIGLGIDEAKQVRKTDDPLHGQWYSTTSLCTDYLALDPKKAPMDDPLVRKAFALATDSSEFTEKLTDNMDIPATTILPPGMPGFNDGQVNLAFNPAAAKEALAQSKYKGSLPAVTLTVSGSASQQRDDVLALVDMWKKNLGVTVQVSYVDFNTFVQNIRGQHDAMVLGTWCADYPDPDNFLSVLFGPDSAFNYANYENDKVNALLDQASTEQDPARRIALYQQAEKLLLEDVAAIPLIHAVYDELANSRIKGFIISPLHSAFVPYLSLDGEK